MLHSLKSGYRLRTTSPYIHDTGRTDRSEYVLDILLALERNVGQGQNRYGLTFFCKTDITIPPMRKVPRRTILLRLNHRTCDLVRLAACKRPDHLR